MKSNKRISFQAKPHTEQNKILQSRSNKFFCNNTYTIPDQTEHQIQLQLIDQARMVGYYETMKTVHALKEKGTVQTRMKNIEGKIKNFFKQHAGVDIDSNKRPLELIDYKHPQTIIQKNAIVIHGIEMMTRISAVRYMNYFQPKEVIFLSISRMKVVFENERIASKALYFYLHNEHPPKNKRIANDQVQNEPIFEGSQLCQWFELIPYSVFGIQLKLFARFSTNCDKKDQRSLLKYQDIKNSKLLLKMKGMDTKKGAKIIIKDQLFLPPYFEDSKRVAERYSIMQRENINRKTRTLEKRSTTFKR